MILDLHGQVARNGKRKAHEAARSGEDLGVDAHDFALHVKERAAGVARIDGYVGLDEGNVLIARQLTALGGHNAGSDRVVQTEGATDGGHPFADLQFVAVAHREVRQILGFDLDDGDVGLGIRTEHFAREFTIVGETHFDFVGAVNNVVVGKNQTVGADDEARTRAAAFRFLTGTAAKGEGKAKAAEDFRVAFVKAKRVGAFNDAGFAHGGNVHDALAVFFNELNEVGQLSCGDGCLRSQAAGNGGRRGQKSAGKSNGGSSDHCGGLKRFGEHFLLLLRYRIFVANSRARKSIRGLRSRSGFSRQLFFKLRQTIKEKGVGECGELWPSG